VNGLAVHEHRFIRGPRSNRTGNWPAHLSGTLRHSHEGGDAPHEHPDTGPASFTLGKQKLTARPNGEQFTLVSREPEFFDVFVLDSALVNGEDGNLRQIRAGRRYLRRRLVCAGTEVRPDRPRA
jgi:hypothetical protein